MAKNRKPKKPKAKPKAVAPPANAMPMGQAQPLLSNQQMKESYETQLAQLKFALYGKREQWDAIAEEVRLIEKRVIKLEGARDAMDNALERDQIQSSAVDMTPAPPELVPEPDEEIEEEDDADRETDTASDEADTGPPEIPGE